MHRNDNVNDIQIFGDSPPPSASRFQNPVQSLDWNGGMECVLQGERSLLMQFSMKVTVGVLFLIEFQDPILAYIVAEPFKYCCSGTSGGGARSH